jgi:hypothetical protein
MRAEISGEYLPGFFRCPFSIQFLKVCLDFIISRANPFNGLQTVRTVRLILTLLAVICNFNGESADTLCPAWVHHLVQIARGKPDEMLIVFEGFCVEATNKLLEEGEGCECEDLYFDIPAHDNRPGEVLGLWFSLGEPHTDSLLQRFSPFDVVLGELGFYFVAVDVLKAVVTCLCENLRIGRRTLGIGMSS